MSLHNNNYDDLGHPEDYDHLFTGRQERRRRKPKKNPKERRQSQAAEVADVAGLEGGFAPTYNPTRHEEGWLLEAVRPFYEQEYIIDILGRVKGGKEANVYRCRAHPNLGLDFLAAKVYRPHVFRQIRNDKIYRQGRRILNEEGKEQRDGRMYRAVANKSGYGRQVKRVSWLMHEFNTMALLYEAGAAVPRPVAAGDNAILMGYRGDGIRAAPVLSDVRLEPDLARPLLHKLLANVRLMLEHNRIHGDLSAYNVLFWDGDVTLIDFPQAVNAFKNPDAAFLLERDVRRLCDYFSRQGVAVDAAAIATELWSEYLAPDAEEAQADLSRLLAEMADEAN